MVINKAEAAAGTLIAAVGVVLLVHAGRLEYMVEEVPGPAFLPLWLGGGILICGLILAVKALRPSVSHAASIDWPARPGWIQIAVMLGGLGIALYLLEALGFLVTASLFIAGLMLSLGVRSWPKLLGVPILAAVILHLVFVVWLGVPLPMGVLSLTE